jgi:hypothetical protein
MEEVGMLKMIKKKINEKRGFYAERIKKLNEFSREQLAEKKKPHVLSLKEIMLATSLSTLDNN